MRALLPTLVAALILASTSARAPYPATAEPAAAEAAAELSGAVPPVEEPAGYRQDGYRAPVPATLNGARSVVTTADAATALRSAGAVFVDVYPQAPRPPGMSATTVWREPTRLSIAGAHWLPNVGYGVIAPETEAYLSGHLARLTGGDMSKPIVMFCLRDCWMSWNAAKRAIGLGYTAVHWFPGGSDAWTAWGFETATVRPVK